MNPETWMSLALTQAQKLPDPVSPRRGIVWTSGETLIATGETTFPLSTANPLCVYLTLGLESQHPLFPILANLPVQHVFTAIPYPEKIASQEYQNFFKKRNIPISYGLCQQPAFLLNKKWFTVLLQKRPYMLGKWAMTADGKIATRTGQSRWISGEEARHYAHQLRAEYDAILVGIGTVLIDDPLLTCRTGGKNPIRLILDRHGRLPLSSKIAQTAREVLTYLFCLKTTPLETLKALELLGIRVCPLEVLSLSAVAQYGLTQKIESILIEGGGTVLESAFQEGILDEVQIILAPKIFGGRDARTPVEGRGVDSVDSGWNLEGCSMRMFGNDFLIQGYPWFSQKIEALFQGLNIQNFYDPSATNLLSGD